LNEEKQNGKLLCRQKKVNTFQHRHTEANTHREPAVRDYVGDFSIRDYLC
jgi:hypothetical protein